MAKIAKIAVPAPAPIPAKAKRAAPAPAPIKIAKRAAPAPIKAAPIKIAKRAAIKSAAAVKNVKSVKNVKEEAVAPSWTMIQEGEVYVVQMAHEEGKPRDVATLWDRACALALVKALKSGKPKGYSVSEDHKLCNDEGNEVAFIVRPRALKAILAV